MRFNPLFATLPAYNAGLHVNEARLISGVEPLRLASNENPYGCSPKALAALADLSFEPWRYSESDSSTLRSSLSAHRGVQEENIIVSNGSEALIAAISRAFLEPGALVVTVQPSFGLHEIEPLSMGANVYKIPMRKDWEFDIDALEASLAMRPRVMFLSSPSNPVGTTINEASFRRLLASVQPGTLFVFDEAYVEFVKQDEFYDAFAISREYEVDFISLRTFSKAYGLAGLRVGYGLTSNVEVARLLRKALTPFNVNGAAQAAAVASIDDSEWLMRSTANIIATRNETLEAIRALGLPVVASSGNFLFIDTGRPATEAADLLLKRGIIVKPWKEGHYDHYIRVSIGLPEEMSRVVEALRDILLVSPHLADAAAT